jgi:hypothetical protein
LDLVTKKDPERVDEKPRLGGWEVAARCGIESGRQIDWMGVTLQESFDFFSFFFLVRMGCKNATGVCASEASFLSQLDSGDGGE